MPGTDGAEAGSELAERLPPVAHGGGATHADPRRRGDDDPWEIYVNQRTGETIVPPCR